jgi:MFS family permease
MLGALMGPTPGVVTWFRVYCGALALVYLALLVGGIAFLFFGAFADSLPDQGQMPRAFMVGYALVLMVLGLVFCGGFTAGVFLPARPWAWVYGIVLIAVGFASPCCIPFSVALLIFWLKPECQAYFGRSA